MLLETESFDRHLRLLFAMVKLGPDTSSQDRQVESHLKGKGRMCFAHQCIVSSLHGKPQGRAQQGGISCSSLAPHRMPAGCSYSMSPQCKSQDLAFSFLFWLCVWSCSRLVGSLGLSCQLSLLLCLSSA